jgi:hypothetical protein
MLDKHTKCILCMNQSVVQKLANRLLLSKSGCICEETGEWPSKANYNVARYCLRKRRVAGQQAPESDAEN